MRRLTPIKWLSIVQASPGVSHGAVRAAGVIQRLVHEGKYARHRDISNRALADEIGVTIRSVKRYTAQLEGEQLLHRQSIFLANRQKANRITICAPGFCYATAVDKSRLDDSFGLWISPDSMTVLSPRCNPLSVDGDGSIPAESTATQGEDQKPALPDPLMVACPVCLVTANVECRAVMEGPKLGQMRMHLQRRIAAYGQAV